MDSTHVIEISDDEDDQVVVVEEAPGAAPQAHGDGRDAGDDDVEEAERSGDYDNDQDDSDRSVHLSDMDDEEDSIFVSMLRRYEELKQEAEERLALAERQPAPVSPEPGVDRPAKRPAKRPAEDGARRSKRRRGRHTEELDLSVEELSPKPTPQLDRSLDDLLNQEDVAEVQPEPARAAVEPEFTARVQAGSLLIRLRMRRAEKLGRLFEAVAERLSLPVGRVCLGQRDVVYRPHQTPDDVSLGPFDVIDFWEGSGAAADSASEPDSVQLRLQSADRRSTLLLRLARTETMASLMAQYAAQRGKPLHRLRFRFDGETLDPTDTPDSLELEGGECVDVHEC